MTPPVLNVLNKIEERVLGSSGLELEQGVLLVFGFHKGGELLDYIRFTRTFLFRVVMYLVSYDLLP